MENSWQSLVEQAQKAAADGNHSYAETIWALALQEEKEKYKRAVEIRSEKLGHEHADTISVRKSFAAMLVTLGREAEANALSLTGSGSGLITGTWKPIKVTPGDSLTGHAAICSICKSKFNDENSDRCAVCGASRQ